MDFSDSESSGASPSPRQLMAPAYSSLPPRTKEFGHSAADLDAPGWPRPKTPFVASQSGGSAPTSTPSSTPGLEQVSRGLDSRGSAPVVETETVRAPAPSNSSSSSANGFHQPTQLATLADGAPMPQTSQTSNSWQPSPPVSRTSTPLAAKIQDKPAKSTPSQNKIMAPSSISNASTPSATPPTTMKRPTSKSTVITVKPPSANGSAKATPSKPQATVTQPNYKQINLTPSPVASKTKGLTYDGVMAQNGSFREVMRVDIATMKSEDIDDIIREQVEDVGLPLVLTGLHRTSLWDQKLFELSSYTRILGQDRQVQVRNLLTWQDREMSLRDLIRYSFSAKEFLEAGDEERLYGKDMHCPSEWKNGLKSVVPPRVVYQSWQDLASALPENERPETLMVYFGPSDTWTPSHRDLCASLGQNLMTWSDPGASSIWFMTSRDQTGKAEAYLESMGQEPHLEGYCAEVSQLQSAPYPVYVCEQKLGDLVLIPSRSMHQVLNRGGKTLKAAWSRLTVQTLGQAMLQDLPQYQRYCRKESYRIKAVVDAAIKQSTQGINHPTPSDENINTKEEEAEYLRSLLNVYDQMLADEFSPEWRNHKVIGLTDNYVECDFCGADVLQSFFECPEGNTLCAMCYCQGRTCSCQDLLALEPCQLLGFDTRLVARNAAVRALNSLGFGEKVAEMTEKAIQESVFPHAFMAACKLRKIRLGPDQSWGACRICKSSYSISSRYKCKPCHAAYCFGCMLHRYYIHPVHALAQESPDSFHSYHKGDSKKDYVEWKEDPLSFLIEAQTHFSLIQAALTKRRCRPIDEGCQIGFLDLNETFPKGLSGLIPPPAKDKSPAKGLVSKGGVKRSAEATGSSSRTESVAKKPRVSTAALPQSSSAAAATQTSTPPTSNGSTPRLIVKPPTAPTAPTSTPAATAPALIAKPFDAISDIFGIFDKENKKRDVLAAQRHQEILKMNAERTAREEERHKELLKLAAEHHAREEEQHREVLEVMKDRAALEEQRYAADMEVKEEIRDFFAELVGDIARAAEAQMEGRPSGYNAPSSNVRGEK